MLLATCPDSPLGVRCKISDFGGARPQRCLHFRRKKNLLAHTWLGQWAVWCAWAHHSWGGIDRSCACAVCIWWRTAPPAQLTWTDPGLRPVPSAAVQRCVLHSRNPAPPCRLPPAGLSKALRLDQTHATTRSIATITHCPPELFRWGELCGCFLLFWGPRSLQCIPLRLFRTTFACLWRRRRRVGARARTRAHRSKQCRGAAAGRSEPLEAAGPVAPYCLATPGPAG